MQGLLGTLLGIAALLAIGAGIGRARWLGEGDAGVLFVSGVGCLLVPLLYEWIVPALRNRRLQKRDRI
jgi:hypothetical protein